MSLCECKNVTNCLLLTYNLYLVLNYSSVTSFTVTAILVNGYKTKADEIRVIPATIQFIANYFIARCQKRNNLNIQNYTFFCSFV
jgi:hypothetical protein